MEAAVDATPPGAGVAGTRRTGGSVRRAREVILLVVVAGLTGACAPLAGPAPAPPPAPAPAALTGAEALLVFDSAWSRIFHTYYDSTFRGLDWHAVRAELRPQAAAAETPAALRAVIRDMLSRLGDSHFQIVPAEHADAITPDSIRGAEGEPGEVGVELRVVDGRLLVSRVVPGGVAGRAGVRTGWALEGVDGKPVTDLLDLLDELPSARRLAEARVAWAAESRLSAAVGDTVVAVFSDPTGRTIQRTLAAEPVAGTPVRFGNLPAMFTTVEHESIPLADGCAGYIRFNVWMTPVLPELEDALLALRHCDGIVLDLRGNPGGVAGMIMAVSGYFMDEQRPLGRMTTRSGELNLVSMPRRVTRGGDPFRPYGGPLALVVDKQSMSASELFGAGLQAVDRARVFGEVTGGQALPAMMIRLPNGDVLVHAFADYVDPDGVRIEGLGVVPDVEVPLRRPDLMAGVDAPVEAALRWIEEQ